MPVLLLVDAIPTIRLIGRFYEIRKRYAQKSNTGDTSAEILKKNRVNAFACSFYLVSSTLHYDKRFPVSLVNEKQTLFQVDIVNYEKKKKGITCSLDGHQIVWGENIIVLFPSCLFIDDKYGRPVALRFAEKYHLQNISRLLSTKAVLCVS